jgi:ABC-type polysaccharide/polyol phosphate export permease
MVGTGVGGYLKSVWACRYFWLSLVHMDLRTRYRRSVLGIGWSLLHPLAMTVILCIVFTRLFHVDLADYAPFLISGLAFWNFVTASIKDGCNCLFQGEAYIRQYPAPVAIYPLRTTLGASFHFLLALFLVLVTTAVLRGFHNPLALLSLVPSLLLLFLFSWALAVLGGFMTVHFPDTQHLLDVFLQILFYATPILYKPDMLVERGLGPLVRFNPLARLLSLLRDPIIDGSVPSMWTYFLATTVVAILLSAAAVTLTRLQRQLIFHL